MIIGIVGKAGSGKDAVAGMIPGAKRFSFADPLKEFCAEVFDWSREQLWGPSELRNVPDKRYPMAGNRPSVPGGPNGCPNCRGTSPTCQYCSGGGTAYLTPRYALQQLGTEWGRHCYPDVWAQLGVRKAQAWGNRGYGSKIAVFSDCRFINEAVAIRAAGGKIWCVTRSGSGLTGAAGTHPSEVEQEQIQADFELQNTGTLEDLKRAVNEALK